MQKVHLILSCDIQYFNLDIPGGGGGPAGTALAVPARQRVARRAQDLKENILRCLKWC